MPEALDFDDKRKRFIEMYPSGEKFYIEDPVFRFDDMVWALAHGPRWNATSSKFISIAEHSIRVSYLIEEEGGSAFEGLVHDVTEAWLGDMPGPWKAILPDYCKLETDLWRSFVDRLEQDFAVVATELSREGHSDACKRADWRALLIEAREVMPTQGRGWGFSDKYVPGPRDLPCYFWEPEEAMDRFINRWEELTW